jgi:hypothetical protein
LQLKLVFKLKSKRKKLVTKNLKKRKLELNVIEQKLLTKNSYILLQRMRFVNRKVAQSILRHTFFLYNDILNHNISVKFLTIFKSNFD